MMGMDRNAEQILIVYSVEGTSKEDLHTVESAVATYRRSGSNVRVEARVIGVPNGASPGATLGTELTEQIKISIGAVVFMDDLRPNVAYELGFFHGNGRRTLLLTRQPVDSIWNSISDLAGAALAQIDRESPENAVHLYLGRLYDDLGRTESWRGLQLPDPTANILARGELISGGYCVDGGPFGPMLRVESWYPFVEIEVGCNLLPQARFTIIARSAAGADLSAYFRVCFRDRSGERARIWLGLSSLRGTILLQSEERNLPAQRPTERWTMYAGDFTELLRKGWVLGTGPVEHLERIRLRAGTPEGSKAIPLEIGFVAVSGRDG